MWTLRPLAFSAFLLSAVCCDGVSKLPRDYVGAAKQRMSNIIQSVRQALPLMEGRTFFVFKKGVQKHAIDPDQAALCQSYDSCTECTANQSCQFCGARLQAPDIQYDLYVPFLGACRPKDVPCSSAAFSGLHESTKKLRETFNLDFKMKMVPLRDDACIRMKYPPELALSTCESCHEYGEKNNMEVGWYYGEPLESTSGACVRRDLWSFHYPTELPSLSGEGGTALTPGLPGIQKAYLAKSAAECGKKVEAVVESREQCEENKSCKSCNGATGCSWCAPVIPSPLGDSSVLGYCHADTTECNPDAYAHAQEGLLAVFSTKLTSAKIEADSRLCTVIEWPRTLLHKDCKTCVTADDPEATWCSAAWRMVPFAPKVALGVCLPSGLNFGCSYFGQDVDVSNTPHGDASMCPAEIDFTPALRGAKSLPAPPSDPEEDVPSSEPVVDADA